MPALDFKPRNTTPLYDAMARMISHVERLSSDRTDEDVTLVVFTAGGENASREVSSAKVLSSASWGKRRSWAGRSSSSVPTRTRTRAVIDRSSEKRLEVRQTLEVKLDSLHVSVQSVWV